MTGHYMVPPELPPKSDSEMTEQELGYMLDLPDGANPLAHIDPPSPGRIRDISNRLSAHAEHQMRVVRRRSYLAMAAGAAVLMAAGVMLNQQRPVHLSAESAQLPDGSYVSLETGAELFYSRPFGRAHRQVTLTGSAFFEVQSGTAPFVVETDHLTVTVHGTTFSVDAASGQSEVFVTEGRVEVRAGSQVRELSAGEGIAYSATSKSLTPINIEEESITDLFIHIKQPLGVMFDAIEERFDIEVMANAHIRQHVHNFKHEVTTMEALVSDLCRSVTSMDLRYRPTATGIEILEE